MLQTESLNGAGKGISWFNQKKRAQTDRIAMQRPGFQRRGLIEEERAEAKKKTRF